MILCVTFILTVKTSHLKVLPIKGSAPKTGVILIAPLKLLYPIYCILWKYIFKILFIFNFLLLKHHAKNTFNLQ